VATEIRLAFALNGGVSLAIWIGGVADEVLRAIHGGRLVAEGTTEHANPWAAICAELDVAPKADVLTGTSAGGLNAAFLAAAVTHGCTDLKPIRGLWLQHGSFATLMRAATDSSLVSLLNGDDHFLPHIEEAFTELAEAGTGFRVAEPPVVVRLTSTSLQGKLSILKDGHGSISSVDHRVEFVFHDADFDFAADPSNIPRMARACRSSASFPGAFEPSTVPAELYRGHHVWGLFDDESVASTPVIDGGVLVNLPALAALDAIIRQPSRERVHRVLALVVPDPGAVPNSAQIDQPTLGQVLGKSLVGIPLTQSLTDFVKVLNEHNLEVRARRGARQAMLAEFAVQDPHVGWVRVSDLAATLFPAYRATRMMTSLDRTRFMLRPELRRAADAAGLADLSGVDADKVPWVPDALAIGDSTWCWGSSAVRRLAAMIITWVNVTATVADADAAPALAQLKADVSEARSRAERISPSSGLVQDLLAEELKEGDSSLTDAFARACARWPSGDATTASAEVLELNGALRTLAECFERVVGLARTALDARPADPTSEHRADEVAALRGVVRLAEGAAPHHDGHLALLLCLEVLEATFSGTEPRPDQEVQLVQFTSRGAVNIDPLQRTEPVDKLAGIELGHFGAFLKASWRANDWLWGRLDGAQRLLQIMDAVGGGRLTAAGTLEQHTRRVQAAILREELPSLVTELERDASLGARISPEAQLFVDAARKLADAPSGPVDLSAASEEQLADLFKLEVVGAEDVGQEVGSNLATVTSIAALNTSAKVLRSQGPRALRRPFGLLGASSSFAWRVTKRGWGINLHTALIVTIAVAGLIGLVGSFVALLTDIDIGAWSYVAVACLVLTPVLALFAAPWLLLGVGRRKMSRARAPV
jgi:patatin-related protein